jgi:hypothetical protein
MTSDSPGSSLATPATPRRDMLASRWHVLGHVLAVALGWVLFFWSWWLVLGQPRDTQGLRNLILGAAIVAPTLTVAWVLHNLGIHRRKGPRRASAVVPLVYASDFNGRRIQADWGALQQARSVVIECVPGEKRYLALKPWPAAPAAAPPQPQPQTARAGTPHRSDFAATET